MTKDARYWIEKLGLEAHPEGGYFRQTYKSDLILAKGSLPPGFTGARVASTAIYFCWTDIVFRRWFGSRVSDGNGFALVGCTVAPGFDFEDFEMGRREELVRAYPQHRE